jgi:hypothetical protein
MKAECHVTCCDRFVSAAVNECFHNLHGTVSDLGARERSAETLDYRHMERQHRTSRGVVMFVDKNHSVPEAPHLIVLGLTQFYCACHFRNIQNGQR